MGSPPPIALTKSNRALPSVCLWEIPDKQFSISIQLSVIDALNFEAMESQRALPGEAMERGGILLGRKNYDSERTVFIESFEPFEPKHQQGPLYQLSNSDKHLLAKKIAEKRENPPNGLSVLGYYRTHDRDRFVLDDKDIAIFRTHFSDPATVFLLIKPEESGSRAGFFFWHEGQIVPTEIAKISCNWVRTLTFDSPPNPPASIEPAGTALPERAFEPISQQSFFSRHAWFPQVTPLWWLVFGFCFLLLGAGVWYRGMEKRSTPAEVVNKKLMLQAEPDGGHVRVSWNREAPAIVSAEKAVLSIKDGFKRNELVLGLSELRKGGLIYSPVSSEVDLDLNVFTSNDGTVTDSVHVSTVPLPLPPFSSGEVAAIGAGKRPEISRESARKAPSADRVEVNPTQALKPASGISAALPPAGSPVPAAKKPEGTDQGKPVVTASVKSAPPAPSPQVPPKRIELKPPAIQADPQAVTIPSPPPDLKTRAASQILQPPVPVDRITVAPPAGKPETPPQQVVGPVTSAADSASEKLDYVPPKPLHEVVPVLPSPLRSLLRSNTEIAVKLKLDASGKVVSAVPISPQQYLPGLAAAAVDAAQHWRFEPARVRNKPVPSETILKFRFRSDGKR